MGRNNPEHGLQKTVAQYLALVFRNTPFVFWTSIDHAGGSKHTKLAGALRKARGVKAGLPDILIVAEAEREDISCVIGIELKAGKGAQSDAQKAIAVNMQAAGCDYVVCRSLEDVKTVLLKHGLVF